MKSVWLDIKKNIKKLVPDNSYKMWLEPVSFARAEDNRMYLTAPNQFTMSRIQQIYSPMLKTELKSMTGKDFELCIEISNNKNKRLSKVSISQKKLSKLPKQKLLPGVGCTTFNRGRRLRNDFTFDKFVVGKNNDFAYSAALSLASSELNNNNNSLFLLSDTGMGKSHLTQALGHRIAAERPDQNVFYITAEDFTNEMVASFRNKNTEVFKDKYRNNCDVLLLEDIHFLSGKEKTQIELAMTLDYLLESGKKIMFSSCHLPADIPKMNSQLKSRFASGLVSNIETPDFRTRVRILQRKSKEKGMFVPMEVMEYLSGELTDNIRQLESGLNGLISRANLLGLPMELSLAERVVKNIVSSKPRVTIESIKKLVSSEFNVTIAELESKSRKKCIVKPRQMAMYLCRRYTDQPLQAIGKNFNRYHATVMHSIGAVEKDIKENIMVNKQVSFLSNKLEKLDF